MKAVREFGYSESCACKNLIQSSIDNGLDPMTILCKFLLRNCLKTIITITILVIITIIDG